MEKLTKYTRKPGNSFFKSHFEDKEIVDFSSVLVLGGSPIHPSANEEFFNFCLIQSENLS